MSMISIVKKLSTTKLTRKEFLVYMGAIFVGIVGIPSLLKLVSEVTPNSRNKKSNKLATHAKPRSFGSGAYGV